MSSQLSTYYLPVTQQSTENFLIRGVVPARFIERIGLFSVLMVGRPGNVSRANLSRALADLYENFLNSPDEVFATCLGELHAEIAQQTVTETLKILSDRGIRFASEEQVASRAWCGANGRYAEAFQSHCRDTLMDYELTVGPEAEVEDLEDDDWGDSDARTDHARRRLTLHGPRDQVRAATAIAAAPDEHFTMSAYAGTGKTHLLLALAGSSGDFIHLAPTAAHSQAFLRRIGTLGNMRSITLFRLATDMATAFVRSRSTRWVNPPKVGETTWPVSRQVEAVGVPSFPGEPAAVVLSKVHRIINAWCFTADNEITTEHVRRVSPAGLLENGPAYVACARRVWSLMSASLPANQERAFDFKLYHLVKWLDVSGAEIPPMGTLFLDEAHDLPAPWYSLLRRYPQGWVAMGDPYQCLSGRVPKAPQSKTLTMVQSVRTGDQATPLFQSVVDQHSERLVDETIVGSRDHVTRPRPYAPSDELPHTGLRAYGSVWKMLEDALRVKNGGGQFRLVKASERELVKAAQDAILLRRSKDRPKSYQLRSFDTWDALSHHLEINGHANVAKLFERGFNETNLDELVGSQSGDERNGLYLGMLAHCKNMEFSTVTMSGCCFSSSLRSLSKDERDKHIKAVYVAMTRVRDELWLPGDAIDRLCG
ncbi:MAG: hypothetical protein RSP_09940 [Rhodanobacter sp.]